MSHEMTYVSESDAHAARRRLVAGIGVTGDDDGEDREDDAGDARQQLTEERCVHQRMKRDRSSFCASSPSR